MPGSKSFETYWDALLSACPLLLSQPNATAGRRDEPNFDLRWRVSTEYCAWLYYTPGHRYEISQLVESTLPVPPDDKDERGCRMPALVDDKRYAPDKLQYVYVLHNHPTPSHISEKDIRALIQVARIHGRFVETSEGRIPVGVVAFFSNSYTPSSATCDGFFEYSLGNAEVVKWTPDKQGRWHKTQAGTVTWTGETEFRFEPARPRNTP